MVHDACMWLAGCMQVERECAIVCVLVGSNVYHAYVYYWQSRGVGGRGYTSCRLVCLCVLQAVVCLVSRSGSLRACHQVMKS